MILPPLPVALILLIEAAVGVYVLATGVRSHWRARRRDQDRRGFEVLPTDLPRPPFNSR